MDEAIGGWKISTGIVAYSGFPETITGPGNNSNSYGTSRVNQYRKLKVVGRSNENWFGTDASATTVHHRWCRQRHMRLRRSGFQYVSARRATARSAGPGYHNVDLSMFKDFHTFREQTIGFRFDAFNAFNMVSYGNPDTGITDSNFGNVSFQGVRSVERHLQFSLKYSF